MHRRIVTKGRARPLKEGTHAMSAAVAREPGLADMFAEAMSEKRLTKPNGSGRAAAISSKLLEAGSQSGNTYLRAAPLGRRATVDLV